MGGEPVGEVLLDGPLVHVECPDEDDGGVEGHGFGFREGWRVEGRRDEGTNECGKGKGTMKGEEEQRGVGCCSVLVLACACLLACLLVPGAKRGEVIGVRVECVNCYRDIGG